MRENGSLEDLAPRTGGGSSNDKDFLLFLNRQQRETSCFLSIRCERTTTGCSKSIYS